LTNTSRRVTVIEHLFDYHGRMFTDVLDAAVSMTDDDVDAALRATELEVRDLAARRAALIAVAGHRRLYAAEGHRSMPAYLRATVNTGRGDISRDRKLARLVDRLPSIGEALMAGHISVAHALELDRVHANPRISHVLDVVGPVLIDVAEHSSYDEFRDRITEFVNLVDVDGAFADLASDVEHRTARQRPRRHARRGRRRWSPAHCSSRRRDLPRFRRGRVPTRRGGPHG
jgi:hypothetical protein